MPRRGKGARLWKRKAQYDRDGKLTHAAVWIIKDGRHRESTGCAEHDTSGAERSLEKYLSRKHAAATETGERPPAAIPIADVLNLYARQAIASQADPKEAKRRIKTLSLFFGRKMLSDINGDLCRAYARARAAEGAPAGARRELEDLRSAVNHHRHEGLCSAIVEVVLPPKSPARERWLRRSEAAKMIWKAWRYREVQKGHSTGRRSRQHVARFLLAALYTTRRKGAILTAALGPAEGRPWIDLERGVFYGRPGAAQSKKRQPIVVVPPRLLGHLRRWHRNGQANVIEFNGEMIGSIDKAFAAVAEDAGLGPGVTPHTTRHTGITWLAIEGVDPYEICRFAGITMEVFEEVYAHHHPDFMTGVHKGFNRHRIRHRNVATEREQTAANVTKIADYSKGGG